ncbi:hypothetical protein BDQ17DRAFT_1433116 [Cyathus striatus]|nr:hypothetical protein BDQ17DRAFT_1433116 [Cyathus striatus]
MPRDKVNCTSWKRCKGGRQVDLSTYHRHAKYRLPQPLSQEPRPLASSSRSPAIPSIQRKRRKRSRNDKDAAEDGSRSHKRQRMATHTPEPELENTVVWEQPVAPSTEDEATKLSRSWQNANKLTDPKQSHPWRIQVARAPGWGSHGCIGTPWCGYDADKRQQLGVGDGTRHEKSPQSESSLSRRVIVILGRGYEVPFSVYGLQCIVKAIYRRAEQPACLSLRAPPTSRCTQAAHLHLCPPPNISTVDQSHRVATAHGISNARVSTQGSALSTTTRLFQVTSARRYDSLKRILGRRNKWARPGGWTAKELVCTVTEVAAYACALLPALRFGVVGFVRCLVTLDEA